MRHAKVLVAVLALAPLAGATAQMRQPPVEPGARVRVTVISRSRPGVARTQRYVGTLVMWTGETLVLEHKGDTLGVGLHSVAALDVSRGRKTNTGKGVGIGFFIGGVAGAIIGYGSAEECTPQSWCIVDPEAVAVGGLLVGT